MPGNPVAWHPPFSGVFFRFNSKHTDMSQVVFIFDALANGLFMPFGLKLLKWHDFFLPHNPSFHAIWSKNTHMA